MKTAEYPGWFITLSHASPNSTVRVFQTETHTIIQCGTSAVPIPTRDWVKFQEMIEKVPGD